MFAKGRTRGKMSVAMLIVALGLWFALPTYLTLQTSFLTQFVFLNPLRLLGRFGLGNWRLLPWRLFAGWLKSSLIVCSFVSLGGMIISLMAGYGFAKFDFRFKGQIFWLFLLAMMVPGTLLFLPKYLITRDLGLFDTYLGMILPGLLIPSEVFLARQYISKISDEMLEAARMDGASELQVFRHIIVPVCLPLVVLFIVTGFGVAWGDFMWQFIIARDPSLQTFTVGIGRFLQGLATSSEPTSFGVVLEKGTSMEGIQAAVSVLQSIPSLLVFVMGQKYFIEGLTAGSTD